MIGICTKCGNPLELDGDGGYCTPCDEYYDNSFLEDYDIDDF